MHNAGFAHNVAEALHTFFVFELCAAGKSFDFDTADQESALGRSDRPGVFVCSKGQYRQLLIGFGFGLRLL